jgi:hypothetical protein
MMPINWCENSIFLPTQVRTELNARINHLVELSGAAAVARLDAVAALGVGGSLARREPAVSSTGLRLLSDVDLIAVLDAPGDSSSSEIRAVEMEVDREITAVKVGIVGVPTSGVQQVSSFFAADFRIAMRQPLRGVSPVNPPVAPIRRRDRVELIVHQVSSTLLHPGTTAGPTGYLLRSDAGYHAVKLPLECLRAVLTDESDGSSYASVFRNRHDARCSFVLPPRTVEDLVRRREIFEPELSGLPNAPTVVVRALAAVFDLAPDPTAVLRHLICGLSGRTDPLSVYQWSCLGLLLEGAGVAEPVRRTVAPRLKTAWAQTHTDDLGTSTRAALRTLARLPADKVTRHSAEVRSLLRQFRLDYYRLLGDHIFGMNPRADYTELA